MREGYAQSVVMFALGWALAGCMTVPGEVSGLERCIWVTRWDYRTQQDIRQIMVNCADAGFTSVIFQVRGNGTVFYPSQLEVWSEDLNSMYPGFDPLAVAVEEAHLRGLQIHAWMNMIPGWRGDSPPRDSRQLYSSRPSWFLRDRFEQPETPSPGRYLGLNPCLPEVRRHLAQLCREVAANYDVDGIHLDYIRFTYRDYDNDKVYPEDRRSLELFVAETGARTTDRVSLEAWKTASLTRLVAQIRQAVDSVSIREVLLTAAVFADPELALEKGNQDWGEWAERELVDALFPMNYSNDNSIFAVRTRADLATSGRTPVVIGVGVHTHDDPRQSIHQMEAALREGASGVSVFSYGVVFGPLNAMPQQQETPMRRILTTWNLTRDH